MNRLFFILMIVLGLTAHAYAGKIYGSITEGGKPVAQGVKVEVTCGTNNYDAQTDAYGAFNLFAMDKGKCALKVFYQGQMPSVASKPRAVCARTCFSPSFKRSSGRRQPALRPKC